MEYELELKEFEDADNFVKGNIVVTATATIPDMPVLSATASASRTKLAGGQASVTISYDGKNYTIDASSDDLLADQAEGTITLTNPDGVKFIINGTKKIDDIEGTVFVGTEQVGTISTANGFPLVRYSDGTFESLY